MGLRTRRPSHHGIQCVDQSGDCRRPVGHLENTPFKRAPATCRDGAAGRAYDMFSKSAHGSGERDVDTACYRSNAEYCG